MSKYRANVLCLLCINKNDQSVKPFFERIYNFKEIKEIKLAVNTKQPDDETTTIRNTSCFDYINNCIGWNKFVNYDAVVFIDNSSYGPFRNLCDEIDSILNCPNIDCVFCTNRVGSNKDPNTVVPLTHMVLMKQKITSSSKLKKFFLKHYFANGRDGLFDGKKLMNTMGHFSFGYMFDSLLLGPIKLDDIDSTIIEPFRMMTEARYPFINKKTFSVDFADKLSCGAEKELKRLMEIMKLESADYSTIISDAIQWNNIYDLAYNLNLFFVPDPNKKMLIHSRVAIAVHLYYSDTLERITSILTKIELNVDIIIFTIAENVDKVKVLTKTAFANVEIRIIKNIGREMESLLINSKDLIKQYDYLCFIHDKKSLHMRHPLMGSTFAQDILDNTIISTEFVKSVIGIFQHHEYIGMLTIPEPESGDYYGILGNEWTINYENTKQLAAELGLTVDISSEKPPISLGNAFWCRCSTISHIYDIDWSKRLKGEPTPIDGSLNHAVERLLPYVVQEAGYLTGILMSYETAPLKYAENLLMVREISHYLRRQKIITSLGNYLQTRNELSKWHTSYNLMNRMLSKIKYTINKIIKH